MPKVVVNNIASTNEPVELEYEIIGSSKDPAMLLIMGFGAQLTRWPDGFCEMLANRGYCVIRFDNRDCGLSTHLDGVFVDVGPVIAAALFDDPIPPIPYTLVDMAGDAIAVLDHLGIERAHVAGMSLGGMVSQVVAYTHPHRVMTLTSISSQPGDPEVGQPTMEASAVIFEEAPAGMSREDYIESSLNWQVWQSKKYRDDNLSRKAAAFQYDRAFYPEGATRQLAAVYGTGRRHDQVATIAVPTLVIHGTDDTLITPGGGERTAELIPNSTLVMVEDMGHDLPQPLWPLLTNAIVDHLSRVQA